MTRSSQEDLRGTTAEGQTREADALDAARYRWLRDQDWFKTGLVRTMCGGKSTFQYVGGGLDAAVDAGRRKS